MLDSKARDRADYHVCHNYSETMLLYHIIVPDSCIAAK